MFSKWGGDVCAAIRLSADLQDDNVIWIDEFEIVKAYRHIGIGKLMIREFIKDCITVIKLLAKNQSVADFWYKCGFQYENHSLDEILMVYSNQISSKVGNVSKNTVMEDCLVTEMEEI